MPTIIETGEDFISNVTVETESVTARSRNGTALFNFVSARNFKVETIKTPVYKKEDKYFDIEEAVLKDYLDSYKIKD